MIYNKQTNKHLVHVNIYLINNKQVIMAGKRKVNHYFKGSSTRRYLQANKRAFSEEDYKVAPCTRRSRSVAACKNRSEKS